MTRQHQLVEPSWRGTHHKSAIAAFATVCVWLVLIFRAPDFWAMLIPEFGRLLQYFDVGAHLQAVSVLRYQMELLQSMAPHMLARGELASIEIGPRQIPFEIKIRSLLAVAVCDISVIIPTLNEEKYLRKCLKSLTGQSQKKDHVEIIVVDGGSSDRTVQIAQEYADKVLAEPGLPVGASRNLGAKHSAGEILAFIDADTMACKGWLDVIARTFDSHPEAVGVTGPTLPYEGTHLDTLAYRVATGWVQRLSLKLGCPHVAGFNCAYRKTAFWNAEGFDEDRVLSEDVMLSLRMRHQGRIIFSPDMIAYTSLRRIKKYGYPYLTTYYAINATMILLCNRTLRYPQVR